MSDQVLSDKAGLYLVKSALKVIFVIVFLILSLRSCTVNSTMSMKVEIQELDAEKVRSDVAKICGRSGNLLWRFLWPSPKEVEVLMTFEGKIMDSLKFSCS